MTKQLLPFIALLPVLLWPAVLAQAEIPALDYDCPGGLRVLAKVGGPVLVNGAKAGLRQLSDDVYEAEGAGVVLSIVRTPDGPSVSYVAKDGGHGMCGSTAPSAASGAVAVPKAGEPCSQAWSHLIEARVITGDGVGHGPDVGSDEWKSVVEFKLGLRNKAGLPQRGSAAWCRAIDRHVLRVPMPNKADAPAFDCRKVETRTAEALVCGDKELATLDRKLAGVYKAALAKAANEHPPMLKAEQRGWSRGRHDCWKEADLRACVQESYVRRIAELQARYRLVPGSGPQRYACDDDPRNEVVVTFFRETVPQTLIAERGDEVSVMYLQKGQGNERYAGRNESILLQADAVQVHWGHGASVMVCKSVP